MVKKQISKIVADYFDKDLNQSVVYLDSHKITEGNLIDECEQCSLNSLYKAVIVENCDFLTAEKNKGKMKYSDLLIDYLKNENANTKLIFSVIYDKKLDSRNKIYKLLSENGKILECKDLKDDDWNVYVTKYFEKRNVGIEKKAINELCKRCDGSLNIFINEANKLLLYKINNISLNDVELVVTKPLENNIFEILDNLLHGNKAGAISIYRDLILEGAEPVGLISIISSSLLFLDRVIYLDKKRYSYTQISTVLKSNPYRVMLSIKDFKNIDVILIKNALESLFLLDKKIKHNEINRFYGFELFLLNF